MNQPSHGHDHARIDMLAATEAAAQFLKSLGLSFDDEATVATPARMAKAYAELLTPHHFTPTTFPNDQRYSHLVIERGIPLRSICEHHMLPFIGTATVAYQPRDRILGLSKLARLVQHLAARPQVQERLTEQIATWLDEQLHPAGAGVVIHAEHLCMSLRGVHAAAETVTTALRGQLNTSPQLRTEFLHLATGNR